MLGLKVFEKDKETCKKINKIALRIIIMMYASQEQSSKSKRSSHRNLPCHFCL